MRTGSDDDDASESEREWPAESRAYLLRPSLSPSGAESLSRHALPDPGAERLSRHAGYPSFTDPSFTDPSFTDPSFTDTHSASSLSRPDSRPPLNLTWSASPLPLPLWSSARKEMEASSETDMCSVFTKEALFKNFYRTVVSNVSNKPDFTEYTVRLRNNTDLIIRAGPLIGRGGFGKTYYAQLRSDEEDRIVALKIVDDSRSTPLSVVSATTETSYTPLPLLFDTTKKSPHPNPYPHPNPNPNPNPPSETSPTSETSGTQGFEKIMSFLKHDAEKEAWIASFLFCTYRAKQKTDTDLLVAEKFVHAAQVDTRKVNRHAKIPQVLLSATLMDTQVLVAMDKMDISLGNFIRNPEAYQGANKPNVNLDLVYEFKMYMFGIACTLHMLQESLNFVHGDFHCENAMLVDQNELVYPCIIDFGFCSINANGNRYAFDPHRSHETVFNASRDLLNMIWSIDTLCRRDAVTPSAKRICEWCQKKLEDAGIVDYRYENIKLECKKVFQQYISGFEESSRLIEYIRTNDVNSILTAISVAIGQNDKLKNKLKQVDPTTIEQNVKVDERKGIRVDDFLKYITRKPFWETYNLSAAPVYKAFIPKQFAISIAKELDFPLMCDRGRFARGRFAHGRCVPPALYGLRRLCKFLQSKKTCPKFPKNCKCFHKHGY
jgi:hypothetical protein